MTLKKNCEGGGVILKDIISRRFNYAEQNCYLKILIGGVYRNDGRGRGDVFSLQSLLAIRMDTNPLNFQLNEPFNISTTAPYIRLALV